MFSYKEIFGDQDFLNQIADVFGLRDDEDEKDAIDKADDIITIFKSSHVFTYFLKMD